MTATAAMMLVEQGKLDLDEPIQNYCSDFPQKQFPLTTRQLLTQTSGIRHYAKYDDELAKAKTQQAREEIQKRQARDRLGRYTRYTDVITPLKNFKHDPLLFEPGSDWKYTSHGYRVLS